MKTAKSAPKNNTNIRVGSIMYDNYLKTFCVKELKVLSNLIVYVKLVKEENGIWYDCVFYNRRATDYAEYISNNRLHKTFYFTYEDALEAKGRRQRDARQEALGTCVENIINIIKRI